jgi:hypothetical protein
VLFETMSAIMRLLHRALAHWSLVGPVSIDRGQQGSVYLTRSRTFVQVNCTCSRFSMQENVDFALAFEAQLVSDRSRKEFVVLVIAKVYIILLRSGGFRPKTDVGDEL